MYRKITRKLSETSRKISKKLSTSCSSSRKVCTKGAADVTTNTTTAATLKPILQRRRKLTESRLPLVAFQYGDQSDVKPNDDDGQVIITLENNTGLASKSIKTSSTSAFSSTSALSSTSAFSSTSGCHIIRQNNHPVVRPSC